MLEIIEFNSRDSNWKVRTFVDIPQARTATEMDGTLPQCIFENLKPVEISKNCFNII